MHRNAKQYMAFVLHTDNRIELDELHTEKWLKFWKINLCFAEKHCFIKAEYFHGPVLVLENLSLKHFLLDSKHVSTILESFLWTDHFVSDLLFHFNFLFHAPLPFLFMYDFILAGD